MKRILSALAFALLLLSTSAEAQCNGVFPSGTVCGNPVGPANIPHALPLATFALAPAGSAGQVQTNGGAGQLAAVTNAQLTALINSVTSFLPGLIPAFPNNTTTFFRGDGTYAAIPFPAIPFGAQAAKTTNYTVVPADCNTTIVLGTGSTAQFTITLPASLAGFSTPCTIFVRNADVYTGTTGHGMTLSQFPADVDTILWPQQSLAVQVNNGVTAWQTLVNPGRWKAPVQLVFHVDKTLGNDANDGLSASAGAVATAQQAWFNAVYRSDVHATTPIIAMACSQTHTTQIGMGGIPLGSNLVQMSPDGNCGFTMSNSGPCIIVGDLAELDLNLTFYGVGGTGIFNCNSSNTAINGNLYLHNQVVLDLEGTPQWQPAGANDNFMICDGPCEYTIANGVAQTGGGTGNYFIYMNEGGKGTQSGAISGTGNFAGVYFLFGPTMLILGGANSLSGTIGTSKIYGHATLVTNGITPAGGTSIGASGVACASLLTNC